MTVPFTHPELVWPDLDARIRGAYAAHARPADGEQQDPAALEHRITALVDAAREGGDPSLSRVPGLADATGRAAFDAAFRTAEKLFGEAGVPVPESGAFTAAGLDFAGLAAAIAAAGTVAGTTAGAATGAVANSAAAGQDPADHHTPALVPVLAPHGLGADWWQCRFAQLRADTTIVNNPLRASADGDGLAFAGDVLAGFRAFDAAPEGSRTGRVPVVVGQRSALGDHEPGTAGEIAWTLRLIPAGPTPVHVNLNHRAGGAEHPTLPEMLALQAGRILAGEPPVDQGVFTWLAGTIRDGRLAARQVWDAALGIVRVSCREIGNQGSYLGVRPPVSVFSPPHTPRPTPL